MTAIGSVRWPFLSCRSGNSSVLSKHSLDMSDKRVDFSLRQDKIRLEKIRLDPTRIRRLDPTRISKIRSN